MAMASQKNYFWDLALIFIAVLGAVWFFYAYPGQHPYSIIDTDLGKEQAIQQATEKLQRLGFSVTPFYNGDNLVENTDLLRALEHEYGRSELIQKMKNGGAEKLPVYFWGIKYNEKSKEADEGEDTQVTIGNDVQIDESPVEVRLTQQGKWIELRNKSEILPAPGLNRRALSFVLSARKNVSIDLNSHLQNLPDSSINQLFNFDFSAGNKVKRSAVVPSKSDMEQGKTIHFSKEDAISMARYYLDQSIWKTADLKTDTTFIRRFGSLDAARIMFSTAKPVMGQNLKLQVDVRPTGKLLDLTVNYEKSSVADQYKKSGIWGFVRFGLLILLSFLMLIIFYRRLKARVIDTRSALFIAMLTGVLIPIQTLLVLLKQVQGEAMSTTEYYMMFLISVGITGAVAALMFFILSGVAESITRHSWSEKLASFDLIRQGLILNKPVGYTIIRALAMTFILAGLWTLVLNFLPGIYIDGSGESSLIFITDKVMWAPLYVLAKNGWISLALVLLVFPGLSSQIYELTDSKRWTLIAGGFVMAILPVFPFNLLPEYWGFIGMLVLGIVLSWSYVQWDVLTVILTLFFFRLLMNLDTSWLPVHSPDFMILLVISGITGIMILFGIWAVTRGEAEKSLPRYVPDYVEELAQEERMKQELEIAHRVQQSFLPLRTPEFNNLDISAICQPAFETGGDYYDFIQLDDHRIAVTIGDVSGKGIQAAFYMTFTKGVLHSLCHEIDSPARLLSKANKLFYQNAPRGTFISLVYGIIDIKEQTFRFARAGHNPILFKKKDAAEVQELQPDGLGLGLAVDQPFDRNIKEMTVPFETGDVLILYTDGIVEALNAEHEFYGMKRMADQVLKNADKSSRQIVESLTTEVGDFMGQARQHDDMTLLVVKLKEEKEKPEVVKQQVS